MCAGALTHKFWEWDVLFKENSGIKAQFLLEILGVPRFGIIENLILFVVKTQVRNHIHSRIVSQNRAKILGLGHNRSS